MKFVINIIEVSVMTSICFLPDLHHHNITTYVNVSTYFQSLQNVKGEKLTEDSGVPLSSSYTDPLQQLTQLSQATNVFSTLQ